MPALSMERLRKLREKTEAASYAEVVKNALRLYEGVIEETDKGRGLFTKDANGNYTTVLVLNR